MRVPLPIASPSRIATGVQASPTAVLWSREGPATNLVVTFLDAANGCDRFRVTGQMPNNPFWTSGQAFYSVRPEAGRPRIYDTGSATLIQAPRRCVARRPHRKDLPAAGLDKPPRTLRKSRFLCALPHRGAIAQESRCRTAGGKAVAGAASGRSAPSCGE